MRLYGEIIPSFSEGIIDRTGAQTMLYLTCTTITSVDLAHYGVSRAKDWVSVDCGTRENKKATFCKGYVYCLQPIYIMLLRKSFQIYVTRQSEMVIGD